MKVEGKSGFINLMRIKSEYLDFVMQSLRKDIEERTKDYPNFKEEMYDKLFTFFKSYFSESGSVYFTYTPLKSKVYEKVYSNKNDVALFWKTYMLYYVKTDKLWNNLSVSFPVDDEDYTVNFDVSKLEHKADSRKRDLIYKLREIQNEKITLEVEYSTGARKTNADDMLREFKKAGLPIDEENLAQVFRVFEKQNEVDYFINKNASEFLKEQFDLWLKNYLFDDESDFSESRLKELKTLKDIAFKVIEFVAQFEDELVRIWNKPKFALNSDYIISLDRIASKEGGLSVIERIVNHEGFASQEAEWYQQGILESFDKKKLFTETLSGRCLSKEYEHLPLDTKYFDEDTKFIILSLFKNLDEELEGWLIHSENYQGLRTILPKYDGKIRTVYIDPPYNTDASAILYKNNYKDSSWLTLLENRLEIARSLLKPEGVICVAVDDEEFAPLNLMLRQVFEKQVGIAVVRSNPAGRKTKGKFAPAHEYAVFYGKSEKAIPGSLEKSAKALARYPKIDEKGRFAWANFIRSGRHDLRTDRPKLYYPIYVNPMNNIRIPQMTWVQTERQYSILEEPTKDETVVYPIVVTNGIKVEKNWQRGHRRVIDEPYEFRVRRVEDGTISVDFKTRMDVNSLPTTWWEEKKYASANYGAAEMKNLFGKKVFDFPKSEQLVEDCLRASNLNGLSPIVVDFFSGSATTAHAAMAMNANDKGNRKFILIEMGDYFENVVIPRVKKVAYSFKWKNGRAQDWDGLGIFCKYYDLEQYEMVLRKAVYRKSHPFVDFDDKSIYQQYVFLKDQKLLEALKISTENDEIFVDLTHIYSRIDVAETLSNLLAKRIRKVGKDWVEFEDGEHLEYDKLNFRLLRPLIWW